MHKFSNLVIIFIVFYHSSAAAFFSPPAALRQQSYVENITNHNFTEYAPRTNQHQILIKTNIIKPSSASKAIVNDIVPAADIIDLDFPVYNALQNYLTPKDSIEHMLYANLRLKNILDNYLAIQKSAKDLLANPSDTVVSRDTTPNFNHQRISMRDQDLINFAKRLKAINQEFQGLVQQINSTISHKVSSQKSALATTAAAISPSKKILSPGANITEAANSYLKDMLPAQYHSTNAKPATFYTADNRKYEQSYNNKDITLPWIIRVPLNIFHYLMTNVIEAVIYGILMLIMVSIISASRSSR